MRCGFVSSIVALLALALAGGCAGDDEQARGSRDVPPPQGGRLTVSPGRAGDDCSPGLHRLRLGTGIEAAMRVTPAAAHDPRALLLVLHGADGSWRQGLSTLRPAWEEPGLVLVAPSSIGRAWNVFLGPDLRSVQQALTQAFRRCSIDEGRIGVAGFSDGATTALTLGLANGQLFQKVIAIAPGALIAGTRVDEPEILVVHGTTDSAIPISRSRDLVAELRSAGYDVELHRFRGGHEVPEAVAQLVVRWFLGGEA
jgi:predicted esterase